MGGFVCDHRRQFHGQSGFQYCGHRAAFDIKGSERDDRARHLDHYRLYPDGDDPACGSGPPG